MTVYSKVVFTHGCDNEGCGFLTEPSSDVLEYVDELAEHVAECRMQNGGRGPWNPTIEEASRGAVSR